MKIAYICDGDPKNKRLWSGTVAYMYEKIHAEYDVKVVDVSCNKKFIHLLYKIYAKIIRLFTKKVFYGSFGLMNAKRESKTLTQFLKNNQDIELIFCAAKSSSIAFVQTDKPIIYLVDATFASMEGYYSYLSKLCNRTKKTADIIERNALSNSTKIICASEWVRNNIVDFYKISDQKTVVIPFGANVSGVGKTQKADDELKLLFCGVEWERKGGDIAVGAYKVLRSMGVNARLYLVGCKPPRQYNDPNIECLGFLNKNNPAEAKQLESIYQQVHFLVLPTVAEAAGLVFIESSAYGIPSITYDTGGVGTYVLDDRNGIKLPIGASASDFAIAIKELYKNKEKYAYMQMEARRLYEQRYNWNAWMNDFMQVVNQIEGDIK